MRISLLVYPWVKSGEYWSVVNHELLTMVLNIYEVFDAKNKQSIKGLINNFKHVENVSS